jgi:hypothetical protein
LGGLRGFRDPAFFRPLMGGRRIRHQNLPEGFFGKRGMASAAEGQVAIVIGGAKGIGPDSVRELPGRDSRWWGILTPRGSGRHPKWRKKGSSPLHIHATPSDDESVEG